MGLRAAHFSFPIAWARLSLDSTDYAHHASSRMSVASGRLPITRVEYEARVSRGELEDARVELLDGRIVSMSPIGGRHRYSVRRLARILVVALGDRANVEIQSSFAASDASEPEPDVLVVPPGDYLDAPPSRAWLVVEVADTSLTRDRAKARLYARAGVPEYWIVNLVEGVIEVHEGPGAEGYAHTSRHGREHTLRLIAFPDVEVQAGLVLPPAR